MITRDCARLGEDIGNRLRESMTPAERQTTDASLERLAQDTERDPKNLAFLLGILKGLRRKP